MTSKPRLPSLYRLFETQADADVRAVGQAHAEGGGDAGAVFWAPREDRFQAAMIVAPDEPMRTAVLSLYLGMLALGDALGSLIPPGVDVTFVWPNRIHLNGAQVGSVVLDVSPGTALRDAPSWLALSFDLAVTSARVEVSMTTLEDEGCGIVPTGEMLEVLARHAMTWSYRWHEGGFAALKTAWINRVSAEIEPVTLYLAEGPLSGRFVDLDEAGDLVIEREGSCETVGLIATLAGLENP